MRIVIAQAVLMGVALALLYGGYINNPLVFDDIYLFLSGNPEKIVEEGFKLQPRWGAYYTLGLTFVYLGPEMLWFRVSNIVIHFCVGMALFALLYRLSKDVDGSVDGLLRDNKWVAWIGAMLFVLHPVAVYGVGYLVQRTILLATLFSLLSWLMFWDGLSGSRWKFWLTVVLYFFAVYSKEHAVMVPAVCLGLLILHNRSGLGSNIKIIELIILFVALFAIAIFVMLQLRGVIGLPYEMAAYDMLRENDTQTPLASDYFYSVVTQAGLFFKYMGLWLVPNPMWMSVDMREPFVMGIEWNSFLLFSLFIIYPFLMAMLLWQGGVRGLVGFSMLTPWLLFATEMSTIRIQEIFVLYRSYLWAPMMLLLAVVIFKRATTQMLVTAGLVLCVALSLFSYDRLQSFSHRFLLWDEAAKLAEGNVGKPGVGGLDRIYYNRGLALHQEGLSVNAVKDFDRSLVFKPNSPHVYNARGAARLDGGDAAKALMDFDMAIRLDPTLVRPYAGRAMALDKMGLEKDARKAHEIACTMGWLASCGL